jgi:hypothetical protein
VSAKNIKYWFQSRIRTINTNSITNVVLHIQFTMCREYSKVFLPPEDDNAHRYSSLWVFQNLLVLQIKVLYFSKAMNLFDFYEGKLLQRSKSEKVQYMSDNPLLPSTLVEKAHRTQKYNP